jgi:hypothetical protein
MRDSKRSFGSTRDCPSLAQASTTETFTDTLYPPRVTAEKRHLLQEYDGCFNRRRIYARHHCTTVLTCKGYNALTARDAALAKAAKGRPRNSSVASFSADPLEETSPSAAGT